MELKLCSIDIETTGLSADKNQTLEIGMVLYDSDKHGKKFSDIPFEDLPKLCLRIIHEPDQLVYDDFVYNMNKKMIDPLLAKDYTNTDEYIYCSVDSVKSHILKFLLDNDFITQEEFDNQKMKDSRLNVVGKNFASFDREFLKKIINLREIKMKHRTFDPSMLYFDVSVDDELPSLQKCMDRSGLFDENYEVAHTSVQDCIDTLKLLMFKLV